jgi:Cu/Ag efflux protein CusF
MSPFVAEKNQFFQQPVCFQRTIRRASGANDDSYPPQGERKMKISSSLSCVSLLALSMSFASAQEARRGTVVGLDELTGSITLQSPDGTVGANNPARSSDKFAVQDGLLFNALREGDKVMFISQKIDGVNTITKLQKE